MKFVAWLLVAASLVAPSGAMAQTADTTRLSCPAGYWQLGSVCLNNSTGDVVDAAPPAAR